MPVCQKFNFAPGPCKGLETLFKVEGKSEEKPTEDQEHPKKPEEKPEVNDEEKVGITAEEFDLIQKCIVLNPNKRLKADEALKHPFFTTAPEMQNVDVEEAKKQHKEWQKKQREEKEASGQYIFFRSEPGCGELSFASRLAKFLAEDDNNNPEGSLFSEEEKKDESVKKDVAN